MVLMRLLVFGAWLWRIAELDDKCGLMTTTILIIEKKNKQNSEENNK